MALDAYLTIEGSQSGQIEGSSTRDGYEGQIIVVGFAHEVTQPSSTGRAAGRRTHGPVTVTKEVDASSPRLHEMFARAERSSVWRLAFMRPSRSGMTEQYYTIELEDATIARIGTEMLNNQYPENEFHDVREFVSFTYSAITWTYEDGSISATDRVDARA